MNVLISDNINITNVSICDRPILISVGFSFQEIINVLYLLPFQTYIGSDCILCKKINKKIKEQIQTIADFLLLICLTTVMSTDLAQV